MTKDTYLSRLQTAFDEAYPTDVEESKERFLNACRLFSLGVDAPLAHSWVADVDEYGEDIVLVDRIHEAVWDIKNALSDYLAFAIMQVHDLVVLLDAAPKLELQLSQTSKDWLKHLEEELSTIEVDPDAKTMLRTSIPIVWGNDVPERLQRFAT